MRERDARAEGCASPSNGEVGDAYRGGAPCPIVFDAEDVRETVKLDEEQRETDSALEAFQITGPRPEGWVPTQYYERAMAFCKQIQADALAAATLEERAEIMGHEAIYM